MSSASTILFGHRGARLLAPENSLESFQKALQAGLEGLETDVWLTADRIAVCDHDGLIRSGWRRRQLSTLAHAELPERIPSIEEVFKTCGVDVTYSIDLKDHSQISDLIQVITSAHSRMGGSARYLWLCYEGNSIDVLKDCIESSNGANIVQTARLTSLKDGPERRAAQLAELRVSAINMHISDWNLGLIELFRRFNLKCFAFGAHTERELVAAKSLNVDGVYSDSIGTMIKVFERNS